MVILEEETYKRFGYKSTDLSKGSHKPVIIICDGCGIVRVKERRFAERVCIGYGKKGSENHNWKGGKVKRICVTCGKEFYVYPSRITAGRGKSCSRSCAAIAESRRIHPQKRKTQILPKNEKEENKKESRKVKITQVGKAGKLKRNALFAVRYFMLSRLK